MPKKTIDDLSRELAAFMSVAAKKTDLDALATKADVKDMLTKEDLNDAVAVMKEEILEEVTAKVNEAVELKHERYEQRLLAVEQKLENEVKEARASRLLHAMHSRKLNFLAIGIAEAANWKESKLVCCNKIEELFRKMSIPDPSLIKIIDCHRLGATPTQVKTVTVNGKVVTKCRPIIFKVADSFMVQIIRDNLPNLKTYFANHPGERHVHVKRHIPKEMFDQRGKLQEKFSELFTAGRKPEWKIDYKTAKYYIKDSNNEEFHDDD